mmetsp:Transcript_68128/g.120506  ORF Transcript_68128/g.120506 Transcript_68128/m.120506 type:complete len:83 (-) Transcript_68128:297-545(-)
MVQSHMLNAQTQTYTYTYTCAYNYHNASSSLNGDLGFSGGKVRLTKDVPFLLLPEQAPSSKGLLPGHIICLVAWCKATQHQH